MCLAIAASGLTRESTTAVIQPGPGSAAANDVQAGRTHVLLSQRTHEASIYRRKSISGTGHPTEHSNGRGCLAGPTVSEIRGVPNDSDGLGRPGLQSGESGLVYLRLMYLSGAARCTTVLNAPSRCLDLPAGGSWDPGIIASGPSVQNYNASGGK